VLKQAIVIVLKLMVYISILVAIFAPLSTSNGIVVFFGSILVGGACAVASTELDDDPEFNLRIWPPYSNKKSDQ